MKKRFILVAALCAAMNLSSFADQTNLALNKTTKASTETAAEPSSAAVDGNLNSRWQINSGDEGETSTDGIVTAGHWIYVDLGSSTTFNTLRIRWEGAYASEFNVFVADEVDAATQEPKWKEQAILTKSETLSNFDKYYTYFLNDAVTARYVKIQAVKLGFGNYMSIYEMGIYNLTADEKVPTIASITADKTTLAPGAEFNVTVTDQFDNTMSSPDITYTCENAENLGDGKFKALTSGDVTVTAKDSKGNEKTVKLVAYVPAMTTAKVSPAVVVTGTETPLTFTVKDQQGYDFSDYTVNGVTDNKITATEDGKHEITLKSGDVEKKVTVYSVSSSADAPTLKNGDMDIFSESSDGLGKADKNWNGHYDSEEVIDVNGNKVWRVTNVGTFGFNKESITDTDYSTLNFDIFPSTNVENGFINYEGSGLANIKLPELTAGKWNHVSVKVEGATKYSNWIQINLGVAGAANNPDILLDNVYLAKAVAEASVLSSVKASKTYVVPGQAFTVTAADQFGTAMTEDITFEATNATQQADGSFKADAEGTVTIKATDADNHSVSVTLTAMAAAPAAPTLTDTDMSLFLDGTEGAKASEDFWNQKYSKQEIVDLNDNNVWHVTNVGTFGLQKTTITDTDYKTLCFDIYPTKEVSGAYVLYEDAGLGNLPFTLAANQWNHIQIDVDGATAFKGYIQLYLGKENAETNPDIFLDNVYLSKTAIQGVVVGTTDANGIVPLKGTLRTQDLADLAAMNGTAFDITKLYLADDVNVADIKFSNPNAIIVVPGSVNRENDVNIVTSDEKWNNLTNAVVKSADGYYFPISQLQIADKHAVYRSFFVSAGTTGFKYVRTLAAKKYSTVFLPRAIQTLPEGVKAYTFGVDTEDANKVVLSETTALAENTPYIVYNGNDSDIDFECVSTEGNMDFRADDTNTTVGNLILHGTFDYFNGDGSTQYGIQNEEGVNDELKLNYIGTGTTVCPFRVYFTLADGSDAKNIKFSFDEATGLNSVANADPARNGNVYSLDGRLVKANSTSVEGLSKGIYVVNGKKVIVK